MERIAFFDTKPYDREHFDKLNRSFDIHYYEDKLSPETAALAEGCKAVCAFVNDCLDSRVIGELVKRGVKLLLMRCAGYNNIDLKYASGKITILRVPAYSPYAVAEHAMALILLLNRKIHKSYLRTRDYNFSINGLTGFDLNGKTAGVIGTGKIGQVFIDICKGFGMKVLAYDTYPNESAAAEKGFEYVEKDRLFAESDVISLHCPLTKDTRYIIDSDALSKMKSTAFIINTSRGKLIDSEALLRALREKRIGAAGLDVYEEETDVFYEDRSGDIIDDETLSLLISMPNVIITSHQAFLTEEALTAIARVTLSNAEEFFSGAEKYTNEVIYGM
ncbi:MAG: 2-hydroxyacid dehydrogenase [Oscillospiraceae bacterium]|nr:2-hydroxyacid dehydrogenase [Oscillospiraceae bacterium]